MVKYTGIGGGFYAGYGCGSFLEREVNWDATYHHGDGYYFGDNYGDGYGATTEDDGNGRGKGYTSWLFDVRIVNTDLEGAVYYTLLTGTHNAYIR